MVKGFRVWEVGELIAGSVLRKMRLTRGVGGSREEADGRKLAGGDWRAGSWRAEAGWWKLAGGSWRVERQIEETVSALTLEVAGWLRVARDGPSAALFASFVEGWLILEVVMQR